MYEASSGLKPHNGPGMCKHYVSITYYCYVKKKKVGVGEKRKRNVELIFKILLNKYLYYVYGVSGTLLIIIRMTGEETKAQKG